nr:LINE-type retrotransposon LIb DNA [Ipomoea batatas]
MHKDWIIGFATNIDSTNNFLAELWGLCEGLSIAKTRGFLKIIAETDSLSTVQVLGNEEDPSLDANTLVSDCKTLVKSFQEIRIVHVLREGNPCADYLANFGQHLARGTSLLDDPPQGLQELLIRDSHNIAISRLR